MKKIDTTIKPIIHRMMDLEFEVMEDNTVTEKIDGGEITPDEIQHEIATTYDISIDYAYLIVYEWMLTNGMENIQTHWFGIITFQGFSTTDNLIIDAPPPFYDDRITITTTDNTDITWSAGTATYIMGSDPATDHVTTHVLFE